MTHLWHCLLSINGSGRVGLESMGLVSRRYQWAVSLKLHQRLYSQRRISTVMAVTKVFAVRGVNRLECDVFRYNARGEDIRGSFLGGGRGTTTAL